VTCQTPATSDPLESTLRPNKRSVRLLSKDMCAANLPSGLARWAAWDESRGGAQPV
jgi:hypothetical protein